jgi:hypothetical protein
MKKDNSELEDTMRPEYDLASLKVRRLGPGRKSFGGTIVRLEPDVAEMFPSADAVNEALRFLVRVTQEGQVVVPTQQNP